MLEKKDSQGKTLFQCPYSECTHTNKESSNVLKHMKTHTQFFKDYNPETMCKITSPTHFKCLYCKKEFKMEDLNINDHQYSCKYSNSSNLDFLGKILDQLQLRYPTVHGNLIKFGLNVDDPPTVMKFMSTTPAENGFTIHFVEPGVPSLKVSL